MARPEALQRAPAQRIHLFAVHPRRRIGQFGRMFGECMRWSNPTIIREFFLAIYIASKFLKGAHNDPQETPSIASRCLAHSGFFHGNSRAR